MAMPRRIPIAFGEAFPMGAFAVGEVEPMRDFDKSTRDKVVQAIDEDSGELIWTLDVIDADDDATKTTRSLSVRLVSTYKPLLPEMPTGMPSAFSFMRPVEFIGLSASPYVADSPMGNGKGRLAWSFRATGLKAPGVEAKPTKPGPAAKENAA